MLIFIDEMLLLHKNIGLGVNFFKGFLFVALALLYSARTLKSTHLKVFVEAIVMLCRLKTDMCM